jgi:hypothetical protein
MHKLHIEQWCVLSGLKTWHIKQYLFFLKSSSPIWNPQYTGVVPGFVFDVKNNEIPNKIIRI